jgi:hypothetical protein
VAIQEKREQNVKFEKNPFDHAFESLIAMQYMERYFSPEDHLSSIHSIPKPLVVLK